MADGFGGELEALRRARGLSYRALAERAGCTHSYVVDLAHGNRGHRPSPDLVERLAAALEVPPDRFRLYRLHVLATRAPELIDRAYHELRSNGGGR